MKTSAAREQNFTVPLPTKLREFVTSKIRSGQFDSEKEVVVGALELMRQGERLTQRDIAELRREIALGLKALDAGFGERWDAADLKAKGRQMLASWRGRRK